MKRRSYNSVACNSCNDAIRRLLDAWIFESSTIVLRNIFKVLIFQTNVIILTGRFVFIPFTVDKVLSRVTINFYQTITAIATNNKLFK